MVFNPQTNRWEENPDDPPDGFKKILDCLTPPCQKVSKTEELKRIKATLPLPEPPSLPLPKLTWLGKIAHPFFSFNLLHRKCVPQQQGTN